VIHDDALVALLQASFPDAEVGVQEYSGTGDHFNVHVRSNAFAGKSVLEQHQMVYAALREALRDGRVHAVQLKTAPLSGKAPE
jgi:stress-induced morphogen